MEASCFKQQPTFGSGRISMDDNHSKLLMSIQKKDVQFLFKIGFLSNKKKNQRIKRNGTITFKGNFKQKNFNYRCSRRSHMVFGNLNKFNSIESIGHHQFFNFVRNREISVALIFQAITILLIEAQ